MSHALGKGMGNSSLAHLQPPSKPIRFQINNSTPRFCRWCTIFILKNLLTDLLSLDFEATPQWRTSYSKWKNGNQTRFQKSCSLHRERATFWLPWVTENRTSFQKSCYFYFHIEEAIFGSFCAGRQVLSKCYRISIEYSFKYLYSIPNPICI